MDAQQVKASMRLYHAVKAETHSVLEKPAEKTKSFKAAVSGDKQVEDNDDGSYDPEDPFEVRRRSGMASATALIGASGVGKTTTIEHLATFCLVSASEYTALHQGKQPGENDALEGAAVNRELDRGTDDALLRAFKLPRSFTQPNEMMDEKMAWIKESIQQAKQYRLSNTFTYRALDVLLPQARTGQAGSSFPVYIKHSDEIHALFRTTPVAVLQHRLVSHVRINAKDVLEGGPADGAYFEALWRLLVPCGTDINAEVARYQQDPVSYSAPLQPWVAKLAGRADIFRTGVAEDNSDGDRLTPNLFRDMNFLHTVNTLMMAPDRMEEGERNELLRGFAEQDPEGPWADLLAALAAPGLNKQAQDELLEALPACLDFVGVFAPMPGFPADGMYDTVGVNDLDNVRRMAQRELERKVDNVVIVTPKTIMTELSGHLEHSPFFIDYVRERVEGRTWKRRLDVMVVWEKCSLPAGVRYAGGNDVNVKYLLKWREHLKTEASKLCSKIRCALMIPVRAVLKEQLGRTPEEVDRLAPGVACTVNVFYSLPLLGLALTQPPEQLLALGIPSEALEPRTLQQLRKATQLDHFLSVLVRPEAEAVLQLVGERDQDLASTQAEAGRLLRVLEMVHKERQRFQRLKLDNARAAPKRNLREQWMGPESKFYNDFHDVFGADGALRRELEPCVSEALDNGDDVVQVAVDHVMQRLEEDHLFRMPLVRLRTVLQPTYSWTHRELPLSTYISDAAKAAWSNSFTRLAERLTGHLRDEVVAVSTKELMVPTLLAFLEASIPEVKDDRERWERTVRLVLNEYGLQEDIRDAFRKAFTPYRNGGGSPMHLYREALESELSAIDRSNAHEQLHQRLAVLSTEPDSSRADAAREVFRTALRQLFREAEARLKDKLRTVLADQWAELLMRLYKRKVHDASRAVSRSKCVFIPAFAQFVRTLLNAVGGDADGGGFVDRGKLDASVADLGRVIGEARAELARLREPKEWVELLGLSKEQRAMWRPAFELLRTRLAQEQHLHSRRAPRSAAGVSSNTAAVQVATQQAVAQRAAAAMQPVVEQAAEECPLQQAEAAQAPAGAEQAVQLSATIITVSAAQGAAAVQGAAVSEATVSGATAMGPAVSEATVFGVAVSVPEAVRGPTVQETAAQEVPADDWDAAGTTVTSEQMAAFVEHLHGRSKALVDCPGSSNDCMLYGILHQVLGIPLDIPPSADTEEQVKEWRQRLVSLLEALMQDEEVVMQLPGCNLSTLGDDSWYLRLAVAAGADLADWAAVQRAAKAHVTSLEKGAQLTAVDLAVLRLMPGWGNVQFIIYNPTWGPQQGYCSVGDEPEDPTTKREVHLANVWYGWVRGNKEPGARGELNHFMVVRVPIVIVDEGNEEAGAGQLRAGGGAAATVEVHRGGRAASARGGDAEDGPSPKRQKV